MRSEVAHNNVADEQGRPAGGETHGRGFAIHWQNGPLQVAATPDAPAHRREPNGAFVEDVIEAAIGRIEFYQASPFHCVENAVALGHLKAAAEVLAERTRGREARGVEGTHKL